MRISGTHLLGLLALISAGACEAAEGGSGEIVSIADARARVAQRVKQPLTVQGQVTFCNQRLNMAFLQDKTGGICFDPRGAGRPLQPGDFVRVTGVVMKRREVTIVQTSAQAPPVMATAPEDFKINPLRLDLDDVGKAHADGLLTRVAGVVRGIALHPSRRSMMSVEVSFPSGTATVLLPWIVPPEEREQWLNSAVICEGVLVCPALSTLAPKEVDALLMVPDQKAWTLSRGAMEALFAQAPIEDAGAIAVPRRLRPEDAVVQRLHLSGVVTASNPRQWVCLRMQDRSVLVMTSQAEAFEPGTRVSVVCCPQMRRGSLVLLDGVFRRTGKEPDPPPPVELQTGSEVEVRGLLAELVRVEGELRNDPNWRGLPFLSLLTPEGNRFVVQWETFLTPEQARFPGTGAKVQLTGILRSLGAGTAAEDAPVFAVIPRTFGDVQVLRSPSWWTRSRLVAAAGWLAVVAGLGLGATMVSRWQIRRERKAVREAEARAIAMEERNRIARELHDSLQQHLAGAALHVETLQGAAATVPQMVPQLLDETAAMIRHCQMEARHCIWDLRSSVPGSEDLAGALEAWLRMKSSQLDGTGLGFHREGEMPMLGREKAFQVLRIVQEAVNNAVAHAGAKQITVRMKGDEGGLQITVTDDGCGFDVNTALVRRRAHFGLLSQRERSARIKGGLEFDSQLQRGTRVTLRVATDSSSPP